MRQRKKLIKRALPDLVYSISTDNEWHAKLFQSNIGEAHPTASAHVHWSSADLGASLRRHKIEFFASRAEPNDAEAWLSDGGMVIFKFWADGQPDLYACSGNNSEIPALIG